MFLRLYAYDLVRCRTVYKQLHPTSLILYPYSCVDRKLIAFTTLRIDHCSFFFFFFSTMDRTLDQYKLVISFFCSFLIYFFYTLLCRYRHAFFNSFFPFCKNLHFEQGFYTLLFILTAPRLLRLKNYRLACSLHRIACPSFRFSVRNIPPLTDVFIHIISFSFFFLLLFFNQAIDCTTYSNLSRSSFKILSHNFTYINSQKKHNRQKYKQSNSKQQLDS